MNKLEAVGVKMFPNTAFALIRWRHFDANKLQAYIGSHYFGKCESTFRLKALMWFCWVFLGFRYWEFIEMRLDEKKMNEIRDFVPRWEEEELYFQINDKKYIDLLENKFLCYKLFQKYYKRDAVFVSCDNKEKCYEKVKDFINSHDGFIIKPIRLYCGLGIEIVSSSSIRAEDIFQKYSGDLIIEELIKEDSRLASFHPGSVNTIRIFTINYGDNIEVKWPTFRIGRGSAVVDNIGSGGIGVAIDVKTGMMIRAADEYGNTFLKHPDTKKDLVGYVIPEWALLCQTVKEMATMCPDCTIMGWDMALTPDDGWCVVECNYGPGTPQYVVGGVRKDFEQIRKRFGVRIGKHFGDTKRFSRYLLKPM